MPMVNLGVGIEFGKVLEMENAYVNPLTLTRQPAPPSPASPPLTSGVWDQGTPLTPLVIAAQLARYGRSLPALGAAYPHRYTPLVSVVSRRKR